MSEVTGLGWWNLDADTFMECLNRAANGEDPDMIYAELYANAERSPDE